MKLKQNLLIAIALLGFNIGVIAQKGNNDDKSQSFGKTFSEADYHIINDNYSLAIPLFKTCLEMQPDNANVNFKLGFCYMNTDDKHEAIPYLEKAALNVKEKYLEFEADEKGAPIETYYYLAKAYHHVYKFDEAIGFYEKFKPYIRKRDKDKLDDLDHQIEMCRNGKELFANPVQIKINNLGDSINSKYPDYAAAVTADENMIIFTSRREGSTGDRVTDDAQYYEDIYVSHKKDDGSWMQSYHLGTNVNTSDHEASLSVSPDGNIVFIYKGKKGEGDIYFSKFHNDEWSYPEKLGSDINTKYWETHATISADGRTLYFVSDRPGGLGGRDVYRCTKLPTGEWSKAQNIGAGINTKYDEDGVFLHPNGKDLYFSSKGHKSMGGYDVFVASLNEDGTWTVPQNMGYPINTADDDLFFVTSADGKRAYYSSDHEGGFGEKDVYMVELERAETPITLLTGKLIMNDGSKKIPDNTITVTYVENGEVYALSKARSNGKYVLTLPPGRNYIVTYEVSGFPAVVEKINVPVGTGYQEIKKEIQIKAIGFGDAAAVVDSAAIKKRDEAIRANNLPVAKETVTETEFEYYFTYNKTKVKSDDPNFSKFIGHLVNETKASKGTKIPVQIEASASKVPTATYGSNEELASKRGMTFKKLVIEECRKKGGKPELIDFKPINAIVGGPDYNNDFIINKGAYEKHQFIKVAVVK